MRKISVIIGTRPEAIKLVPIILKLKKVKKFNINICVTAQHREMLDQVLEIFNIKPNFDLNLMKPNQSLSSFTSEAIKLLDKYFSDFQPDFAVVQGDTTTAFAASLVAFYHKIQIGHVEAGLRTWNKFSPFPEEINRVLITKLADLHFAPTELSKKNLIKEGINENRIFVTGNTVIDTLLIAKDIIEKDDIKIKGIPENILGDKKKDLILITGHRRENFGEGFKNICFAISKLANKYKDISFIYPVHLNPNVQKPVYDYLAKGKNIYLIKPQNYLPFVALMNRAKIILTDSGGVQEEAPSFGKPVLVMRNTTERPEGVDAGTVKLVGTNPENIINETVKLLNNSDEYSKMANAINPYGDGKASERIVKILDKTHLF